MRLYQVKSAGHIEAANLQLLTSSTSHKYLATDGYVFQQKPVEHVPGLHFRGKSFQIFEMKGIRTMQLCFLGFAFLDEAQFDANVVHALHTSLAKSDIRSGLPDFLQNWHLERNERWIFLDRTMNRDKENVKGHRWPETGLSYELTRP
jgi:hypothetical protein